MQPAVPGGADRATALTGHPCSAVFQAVRGYPFPQESTGDGALTGGPKDHCMALQALAMVTQMGPTLEAFKNPLRQS